MRKAVISIAKKLFNASYRRHCSRPRRNLAVFLSRQTDSPSYDFIELSRAFEARGWDTEMHLQKVTKRSLPRYLRHALRETQLLAECRVAIVDRFDPVIGLMDFECDLDEAAREAGLHYEFPTQPVIMQVWHAFGAFKKFGFQSADTLEGHARDYLDDFCVHRNFSWVLCSGAGAREAFAQAFAYPTERVVALARPEYDELLERRRANEVGAIAGNAGAGGGDAGGGGAGNSSAGGGDAGAGTGAGNASAGNAGADNASAGGGDAGGGASVGSVGDRDAAGMRPHVLMAPTLRKSAQSAHPFRELYNERDRFETQVNAQLSVQAGANMDARSSVQVEWAFHPLEANLPAPGNVSEALLECDLVVTDYSSLVYEASLLGKPVLFYVPDIDAYRVSPGLNVDPVERAPELCAGTPDELAQLIGQALVGDYPADQFERFIGDAFSQDDAAANAPGASSAAERIVDFAIAHSQE